jgi:hypothetical protein
MAALLVPPQIPVGDRQAENLRLRDRHVDELLTQLVVAEPLDAPGH